MNIDFNIDNYLRLSWQDILMACISTLIIVLVAKHFFWDKLQNYLARRQEFIAKNLEESKEKLREAHALRNDYQKQMDGIQLEAEEILNKARAQADHESRAIIAKAREEADYQFTRAKEEIDKEKARAEHEMKEAISDVAIAAAGQILSREIDLADQQALIDEFIDQQLEASFHQENLA